MGPPSDGEAEQVGAREARSERDHDDGDGGRPRHGFRFALVVACVVIVLLAVIVIGGIALVHHNRDAGPSTTTSTLSPAERALQRQQAAEEKKVAAAVAQVGARLPTRDGETAPSLPAGGFRHPLPSHQVVAYLPYWYLGAAGATAYQDLTTVAYFSVGIAGDGALDESGQGWSDIGGEGFAEMVEGAHTARDRVLLTVSTDDQGVLDDISKAPASAADRLVPEVASVLRTHGLDGLDLDLEGQGGADRKGFARFVQLVAAGLRRADASWELAIDTYPQSAADPDNFFDIPVIAASVDQIFVMAYDMFDPDTPSANAPLGGAALSDANALQTYTDVVPASKLILGVPFYGEDWEVGGAGGSAGDVQPPDSLAYSTIAASGHVPLWDPATDTVWFSYRYQGREHVTWFDNPLSLALKTALASEYHVAGVGMWALGMQGGDSAMLSALLGGSPALKLPAVAPAG